MVLVLIPIFIVQIQHCHNTEYIIGVNAHCQLIFGAHAVGRWFYGANAFVDICVLLAKVKEITALSIIHTFNCDEEHFFKSIKENAPAPNLWKMSPRIKALWFL